MSSSHEWIGIDPTADNPTDNVPPPARTAGQVAYEAWCEADGWSGHQWPILPEDRRAMWESIAAAVLKHASGR